MIKKCSECEREYEYENEEELKNHFYQKKTWSGTYFQRVCKECTKAKHRLKWAKGDYRYTKKQEDYEDKYPGKVYSHRITLPTPKGARLSGSFY